MYIMSYRSPLHIVIVNTIVIWAGAYCQSFYVGDELLHVIYIIRVLMMVAIKSHLIDN